MLHESRPSGSWLIFDVSQKTTMPKVILIDDNAWEHVAAKLKSAFSLSGHELDVFASVDQCQTLFQDAKGRCPADIFVVDVMMPPGETYKNEETHDGLITGLYLARDIRKQFPIVPIVLWSGSNLDTVRLLAVHMEKKLTKCIFVKKPFTAAQLIALINGYFDAGKFSQSWVRQIWEGIVLRPSIGGLGIDVKKLLDSKSQ
jgi:CheY-like chemotaxis protein